MWRVAYLTLIIALGSCSNTPPTEEELFEREYNEGIDKANWVVCTKKYLQQGEPTYHKGHTHDRSRVRPIDVRFDLIDNNCKRILGDSWADRL